jgi:hypothetical protein
MWLGDSESLLWELDAVVQSGSVDRTLFLIPAATSESQLREKYDNLWCKIAGRPGYSRFPSNMRGDERFLYFHRDGRAEVVTETARSKKDVGSLLAPFFAHVGVALPGKPFSPDALVGNLLRFCVGGYPIVVYFARYVR